jgi:uncharacterized protein YceH (UPF0502 family)
MQFAELTGPEQRVLGCLLEKRWTTPDQYPLSLNSLRLACNQSTNRDPVTDYDEAMVRNAAQRLCHYGLARLVHGHGARAIKYRHLAEEALGLDREELAILSVLLLRGPQTPGELKARSERLARLGALTEVERILDALGQRGYIRRLERRPGQKEDRFQQLLGGEAGADAASPAPAVRPAAAPPAPAVRPAAAHPTPAAGPAASHPAPAVHPAPAPSDGDLAGRVAALETEIAALRAEVAALRDE